MCSSISAAACCLGEEAQVEGIPYNQHQASADQQQKTRCCDGLLNWLLQLLACTSCKSCQGSQLWNEKALGQAPSPQYRRLCTLYGNMHASQALSGQVHLSTECTPAQDISKGLNAYERMPTCGWTSCTWVAKMATIWNNEQAHSRANGTSK